jgi:hypothetical protein
MENENLWVKISSCPLPREKQLDLAFQLSNKTGLALMSSQFCLAKYDWVLKDAIRGSIEFKFDGKI